MEIFLSAGNSADEPYHQIQVNAAGALKVGYHRAELPDPGKFQAAASREKEAWTVELAMPYASLQRTKERKAPEGTWRLNLVRSRPMHRGDKKIGGARRSRD